MSGVTFQTVSDSEDGLRVDRWLRSRFPNLKQGKLQKLLRTGQVRLDGRRVKANERVESGQEVRIPPSIDAEDSRPQQKRSRHIEHDVAEKLAAELKESVVHIDDEIIALNKPAGLAVQGGSKTEIHLDGVLDWLKFGAKERPRLVHRLDKDTSGILVLARTRKIAGALSRAFQGRETKKVYWAIVEGVPQIDEGIINAPLAKLMGGRGELVEVSETMGQSARTDFRVVDKASKAASWLVLEPKTGRTHQLRAHCKELGTPIYGDPKYGTRESGLDELGLERRLHLHARELSIALPHKRPLTFTASLPRFMTQSWKTLGFDPNDNGAALEDT